jgi:RNA polymerase sigma-70 factor (family 1)
VFKVVSSYKALSDNELIQLLKSDDELALSELYLRYWDKLLVVAGNRIDDYALAEEAVQDVFISLWKRRHTIELTHALSTYLAVAIKYRVIRQQQNQFRYIHKLEASANDTEESFAPSADEHLLEKEILQRIEASVLQLPEKCRIVFRMSREDGKTYRQIATELEISEKTVEQHMSKAIKHLRSDLTTLSPAILLWVLGTRL